jgi:hypothetical protein
VKVKIQPKMKNYLVKPVIFFFTVIITFLITTGCTTNNEAFNKSGKNGIAANEGLNRCVKYVHGWLKHADTITGLIPRNLDKNTDIWNARDAAADNYPFMVLTCALTDLSMFNGKMLDMLRTERKLTSRIGTLPDTYSFSKQGFNDSVPDLDQILFGASEYIKDGLLPLTEWLGESPWSDRMIEMLDDMLERAPVQTSYGNILSMNHEVNGEMLQTLSRVYWMTGKEKYLEFAIRLGDYYLLGENHPTRDFENLRLRDHGCEIVSGLTELYATVYYAKHEKYEEYKSHIHEMLNRILEVGQNENGMFFNNINPKTGQPIGEGIADTWGYTYNGFYTVYLIDNVEKYRESAIKALNSLYNNYRNYKWERESADGYADAIESAINLFNREPIPSVADWIDSEIKVMWEKQQSDGTIEGWHGDGNFARTTIMYCLWKTLGLTAQPWRNDLNIGAVMKGNKLFISLYAEEDWNGKIIFDKQRHQTNMNLPFDWPRINQFPEWYTINTNKKYVLNNINNKTKTAFSGQELTNGIDVKLNAGEEQQIIIK